MHASPSLSVCLSCFLKSDGGEDAVNVASRCDPELVISSTFVKNKHVHWEVLS